MPDLPEERLTSLRGQPLERPTVPAVDVRRRGDRRRRARHAGSVVAAAAVVAALAGGVAALAPGDSRTTPDPVDTPTPTVTPSALPEVNEDGSRVEVADAPGTEPIVACGTPLLDTTSAVDVAGVSYAGGEDFRSRTLVLLGSEAAAQSYVDRTAAVVADCAPRTVDGGANELVEPLAPRLGVGSAAFMVRFENAGSPLTGATTYHLVRVANAVLITTDGGETANTAAGLAAAVDAATTEAAEVLAALAGDPAPPAASSSPAPPATTEIPADLPLDIGLVATDGDVEVTPPGPDVAGIGPLDLCGTTAWPPSDHVDRLVTSAAGPEYAEVRELWVFADAGAAVATMAGLRDAASECTRDGTRRWDALDPGTGYDTVTLGLSHATGLGAAVHQWTRVGAAVLLVHRSGEGRREGLPTEVSWATGVTRQLAPRLCPFTADGC